MAGAATCSLCAAGRWGAAPALPTADCNGTCTAGYACAAGSTSPTAVACGAGRYSLAGAGACSECPPGRFGSTQALATADCSGLCPAGRYGSLPGLTSAYCEGACVAGYTCLAGSLNGTAMPCPAGQYSLSGAPVCSPCAPGWFGSATALNTSACSGPCGAGRYGGSSGLTAAECSGPCTAGYVCCAHYAHARRDGCLCAIHVQPCPSLTLSLTKMCALNLFH
jgi:hypothetical protein